MTILLGSNTDMLIMLIIFEAVKEAFPSFLEIYSAKNSKVFVPSHFLNCTIKSHGVKSNIIFKWFNV